MKRPSRSAFRLIAEVSGGSRSRYLGYGIVLFVLGAAAGLGNRNIPGGGRGAAGGDTMDLILAALTIAVMSLVVSRICRDHDSGWVLPVFASGLSRQRYVATVFAASLLVSVGGMGIAWTGFAIGGGVGTGYQAVLSGAARITLGLAGWVAYALLVAVLLRRDALAYGVIAVSVVAPFLLVVSLMFRFGGAVAEQWDGWLTLHLPPLELSMEVGPILHAVGYVFISLGGALWLSRRLFARYG